MKTTVALLFALALSQTAFANIEQNAFSIIKDKNKNTVVYDIELNSDCSFAKYNPFNIYWLLPTGSNTFETEPLGFFEKGIYGVNIIDKKPNKIVAEVKSIKNRNIDIRITVVSKKNNGSCLTETFSSGNNVPEEVQFKQIKLEKFKGEVPHQLAVSGRDTKSGDHVEFNIVID